MYIVKVDGQILHNPALDDPSALVVNGVLTQQANAADCFKFTVYPSNAHAGDIYKLSSIVELYGDNALLFRGRPIQSTEGWQGEQTYTCEGGFSYFNDTIVRPYTYNGTVRGYLEMLVSQHNSAVPAEKQFTVRTVTVNPNASIELEQKEYTSTMEELQGKLVSVFGGYLVPVYTGGRWYLDYLSGSVQETTQTITIAHNLIDFIREQNAENIATGLIPLGAKDETTGERLTIKSVNDGRDYITDQSAVNRYGLIFHTEIWDDVTNASTLLSKAQAKLSDLAQLVPTISLTAIDLSLQDSSIDPIRFMDTVTVQDEKHHASGQYLVSERTYNISAPERDTVTFGGEQRGAITKQTAKNTAETASLPSVIMGQVSGQAQAVVDAATYGAIQILYNASGVAYELRINNAQNPASATKWWRFDSTGWWYTDDAGSTYKPVANMNGAFIAGMTIAKEDNPDYLVYISPSSGIFFQDSNGTKRCELDPTGGLKFYDATGTLTKTYGVS